MSSSDQASGLLTGRNACPPQFTAQLMPHGGPRVVQRLLEHLTTQLGCAYDNHIDPRSHYPEANSPIEADMLDAIAKAQSPAAIDLLAQQSRIWRGLLQQAGEPSQQLRQTIAMRSHTLDQLIHPPTVVVVGPANVGKSTLTNALMGKKVSIVADLPGTTRDWVGGLVELGFRGWDLGVRKEGTDAETPNSHPPTPNSHIAVQWLDTPGLRERDDPIEQRAITLAKQQIEQADVLIAMRDPDQPWPDAKTLPRDPDLYLMNKVDDAATPSDDAGATSENPLSISARNGLHLDRLQSLAIERLGLDDLRNEPWAFSSALVSQCASFDHAALSRYLGEVG